VIEDCAHSAGGVYKEKKLGRWGDISCFSFEEKKCMTTGDGGMISSDDYELIKPLRSRRWVGINKDTWQREKENLKGNHLDVHQWYYEISDIGYKYNMNDLMAAIGLAQLKKLNQMNKRREEIIRRYIEGLNGKDNVRAGLPYTIKDSSYWMFMVRVKDRDRFILHMKKNNIATGVHYMPLTMHPLFQKYKSETPVADKIWQEFVTLPLFPDLKDEEVDYVINTVKNYQT
jgi:perosamine synthetase